MINSLVLIINKNKKVIEFCLNKDTETKILKRKVYYLTVANRLLTENVKFLKIINEVADKLEKIKKGEYNG